MKILLVILILIVCCIAIAALAFEWLLRIGLIQPDDEEEDNNEKTDNINGAQ